MSTNGFGGVIGRTTAESTPWFPERPQPPEGAPNVVYIVLDDTGFAHLGCYGSDIETPNMDRLAAGGIRYNNFHTTALCSPTRACLLTGRNHHSVGVGRIAELNAGFPGYYGACHGASRQRRGDTPPQWLQHIRLGKWHLLPNTDTSAAGPYDHWPLEPRLRPLLRFPGRRDQPVEPRPRHGERAGPAAAVAEEGYHLSRGSGGPGDHVRPGPEVRRAGQALLPLPGLRRHPRAAPRSRATSSRSTGAASTTAGTPPASASSSARSRWASCRRERSWLRATMACAPGTICTTTSSATSLARRRCSPGSWTTPTTTSAGCWTSSKRSGSSKTRSSS